MKICLISSALPPQMDGIGDYTARLAAELAPHAAVTVLTEEGHLHTPIPGVHIEPIFSVAQPSSVRKIEAFVTTDRPDWLMLQYNPFAYGRWGLNLYLPLMLRAIKKNCPEVRIALMAHETYVQAISVEFAVMTTWQRWQLWQLGQAADQIFFSIELWVKKFRPWFPNTPVSQLPIPSNILRVPLERAEARARLGIADSTFVIGVFGTAHISRMMNRIRNAAHAVAATGRDLRVLYIGPQPGIFCEALAGLPLLAEGPLPVDEVSRRFSAMDVHLTPFLDGISARRGSVMAGLQHGIATVGTRGCWTDPMLLTYDGEAFVLADVGDSAAFTAQVVALSEDPLRREQLGRTGQELYEQEFSWDHVVSRLMNTLSSGTLPLMERSGKC